MASLNKVIVIGNLGNDPDIRYMPNGDAACTFSLAVTERWKDKAGEKQESTEWIRCVAYAKRGEVIGEFCHKGDSLYIEGKMKTRKWEKDGHTNYTTEVIVGEFQFNSKRDTSGGSSGESQQRTGRTERDSNPAGRPGGPAQNKAGEPGDFSDFEDDIPF